MPPHSAGRDQDPPELDQMEMLKRRKTQWTQKQSHGEDISGELKDQSKSFICSLEFITSVWLHFQEDRPAETWILTVLTPHYLKLLRCMRSLINSRLTFQRTQTRLTRHRYLPVLHIKDGACKSKLWWKSDVLTSIHHLYLLPVHLPTSGTHYFLSDAGHEPSYQHLFFVILPFSQTLELFSFKPSTNSTHCLK